MVVAEINEIFENFLSPEVLGFLLFGGKGLQGIVIIVIFVRIFKSKGF